MDGRGDVLLYPTTADNKLDTEATPHVRLRAEMPANAVRLGSNTVGGVGSHADPGNEPMQLPRRIDQYFIPR
ncbi:MAG: hypothetical protein AAGC66_08660 [Leifsonia sp.]